MESMADDAGRKLYVTGSKKVFQIGTNAYVKHATCQVISAVTHVEPETADFDAYPAGKAGQTAVVAHRKFFLAQVVIAEAYAERFVTTQQELAVENKVPEKVVHLSIALAFGLFVAEQQHVLGLGIGIVVA